MREPRLRSTLHLTPVFMIAVLTVTLLSAPGYGTNPEASVTGQLPYIRQDGGTDATIQTCSSTDGTGGGRRQHNEPSVAINPSNPAVIVAGANDYCGVPTFHDAWMGFYVSVDGGTTWANSLNPGYPGDTSAAGQASPIFGIDTASGDPAMGWDNANLLFYGGIAFNRTAPNASGVVTPGNGNAIISTWQHDPTRPLGMRYLRTVVVGEGTPARFGAGRFNDKDSVRVDTWATSPSEGNVYFAWTLFPGIVGQDQILFSRSTDHGHTFSKPIKISKAVASAQGSAIAVAPDGTVYVTWRQFAARQAGLGDAILFAKSTDGGQTFSDPRTIANVPIPYDRSDLNDAGAPVGDCGDGPFHCQSNYTFHRTATLPEAVVDASGAVNATWEQVIPAATPDATTYQPKGQSQIVFTRSTNGGASWQTPRVVDPQPLGHQWWPNIAYDKSTNTLALIYYDSRADNAYDPNRPPGNTADGTSTCGTAPSPSDTCNVLNAFIATSSDGGATWTRQQVSTVGHQPEYEMFGGRRIPFHGDYLYIDAAAGTIFGVWTDNRTVVPGSDPRDPISDGFDVVQCRASATSPDTCPNAGGLNQSIFGAKLP